MTNEEFERQKDFILNQQAQFSSDIIELKSGLTELRDGLAELRDIVTRLANVTLSSFDAVVNSQLRLQEDFNQRTNALVDSQMKLSDRQDRATVETNRQIAALINSQAKLSESQKRTDENLRDLINVVDRHFQDRNGGGSAR